MTQTIALTMLVAVVAAIVFFARAHLVAQAGGDWD